MTEPDGIDEEVFHPVQKALVMVGVQVESLPKVKVRVHPSSMEVAAKDVAYFKLGRNVELVPDEKVPLGRAFVEENLMEMVAWVNGGRERERGDDARCVVAELSAMLDVDLLRHIEGDGPYSYENMRRVVAAFRERLWQAS